ncbi:alpha/beta hydrolase family protein [Actinopolyspora mortivallis]|uniref:Alpha/beta hydrolase n=1 Tax=Actinopolyspora mortivallis TaxID=33906 RepID=A0A2T0GV11_ACTMO|nr:alpha/beta hydrolase [Actinopolyspora mortivallis]PRW62949.1 alpha/beta hydrolase [Actinopolyspora mortivallis]
MLTSALFAPLTASAASAGLSGRAGADTSAESGIRPWLPAPTGPYPVGRSVLSLVDRDRTDPWRPRSGNRRLMVSVWYPALPWEGTSAPYVSPAVSELVAEMAELPVPPKALSRVHTNSGPEAAPRPGPWPLVVLSPGFGNPRAAVTGTAEELASHGTVVAGVDHTYEAPVEFPDGRVTECAKPVPCEFDEHEELQRVVLSRVADFRLVLESLVGPGAAWSGAHVVDGSAIAAVGHSIGGAAAVQAAHADPWVRAGANMDGTIHDPDSLAGTRAPVLLLGNGRRLEQPDLDPSWHRTWSQLAGWKRFLLVRGTGHSSFTDWPVLIDQLGLRDELPADTGRNNQDRLPALRSVLITRAYVTAFVRQHLAGETSPLFDGPSPHYPEVVFSGPDSSDTGQRGRGVPSDPSS